MEYRTLNILLTKVLSGAIITSIGIIVACSDKPNNPTTTEISDFPAVPTNVIAMVGDGMVVLTWLHPNENEINSYKIYRQDSSGAEFRNLDTTNVLKYTDSNLQNNHEFRYQISAVGANGLEGSKSTIISAVPAVYGVSINFGQEFTTIRTVTLSFTAPFTTSLIKISNDDSLFTNAQWESYVKARNWTVSENDGNKTVFVKFRNVNDSETIQPFSDSIILDTQAVILHVTEDSGGRVLTRSDTIHFSVVTEEPGGTAYVELGSVRAHITLNDNGINGDLVPDDGIYELDYIIPSIEVEGALITGHFIDKVGNSDKFIAPGFVTIRQAPQSVNLISVSPVISDSASLNLFWTMNTDADFANYRIFRSGSYGVNTESPLVTIIQDQATLSYADTTLIPNSSYYYRVYVFDTSGLFSGSNEVRGTTNPN